MVKSVVFLVAVMVGSLFGRMGVVRAQDILPTQLRQGFGKNKVRYRPFDWWKLRTEHFEIYYEPVYRDLARAAAEMLEEGYVKLSRELHHHLSTIPPIIIFQSHYDFEQTNVVQYILPPGVGGFAETLKYRVVLPFGGDLEEFRHVLVHELTHIFQYDILYHGPVKSFSNRVRSPPMWIMEGMAEYEAGEMNVTDEMVLRDAILTDTTVPFRALDNFGNASNVFLAYKESHSLMQHIAQKYGPDKIRNLLREWSGNVGTERLVERILNTDLRTLNDEWLSDMRKRYWPMVSTRDYPFRIARQIPKNPDKANAAYLSPSWSLGGEMLAVLTVEGVNFEVELIRVEDGEVMERITDGMRGSVYTYLKMEEGALAWSPDGEKIAFAARMGPRDRILIWDLYTAELTDVLDREGLQVISTLAWSPDGRRLTLSGSSYGQTDIYVVDVAEKTWTRITDTPDRDAYPSWSWDGRKLAFSAKRDGNFDILAYDLDTRRIEELVCSETDDLWPRWLPDGEGLIFVSTRERINDLFSFDPETGEVRQLTRTLSGISEPAVSPDGKRVAFISYYNGRRGLYTMELPSRGEEGLRVARGKIETSEDAGQAEGTREKERKDEGKYRTRRYKPKLELDGIGGGMTFANRYLGTLLMLSLSDVLGNHTLDLALDYTSGFTPLGQINDLNFALLYGYYARRTQWAFGIFNWTEYFVDPTRLRLDFRTGIMTRPVGAHRQSGFLARTTYPVDLYRRWELTYTFLDESKKLIFPDREPIEDQRTHLLRGAYVYDSVIYGPLGPTAGRQYYLSAGRAVKLGSSDREFTHLETDYRVYAGKRSVFAFRMLGLASLGKDAITYYLGGPSAISSLGFGYDVNVGPLRGFEFSEFAGTRIGLMNLEVRVPLMEHLRFGWPTEFSIRAVDGSVFFDAGTAWDEDHKLELWTTDPEFRLKDLKAGLGFGLLVHFLLPIHIEFAKATDLSSLSGWRLHFSFGTSF